MIARAGTIEILSMFKIVILLLTYGTDWTMFAAAASGDNNLLSSMISLVHAYTFTPSTNLPLSPLYDPTTGNPGVTGTTGINR